MANEDLHEVKVDVEVLKHDMSTLTRLCEKMDKVIEKLVDHQDVIITQIYTDMDKRKSDTNQDVKELHSRITNVSRELNDKLEETEDKIMNEIKEMRQEIKNHNDREQESIAKLLQWKWTIVGGIIVITWLTQHIGIDTILKLIN